jgi:nucleoside-diphosphate-sugar epimerase
MRVLVLGGTGSIGSAVVAALVGRGHRVAGLARSDASARKLAAMGAEALPGDARAPEAWLPALEKADAVVHAATDFASDMAALDRGLMDALLPRLSANTRGQALLYTGGCWLYGATGDTAATERTHFDPPPAFAFMVPAIRRVLAAPGVRGVVVHPAMVFEGVEGVFARFAADARALGRVRVVGDGRARWPLVHRRDLADLYALALEKAAPGASYNAAAAERVPAGAIARAVARWFGADETPVPRDVDEAAAELGEWARGYALDQRMSGGKARRDLGWNPNWREPLADLAGRSGPGLRTAAPAPPPARGGDGPSAGNRSAGRKTRSRAPRTTA